MFIGVMVIMTTLSPLAQSLEALYIMEFGLQESNVLKHYSIKLQGIWYHSVLHE